MPALKLLKYHIVFPLFGFLIDKAHPIDEEQEQHLKSLFVWDEAFVIPLVFIDVVIIASPLVLVNFLPLRNFK